MIGEHFFAQTQIWWKVTFFLYFKKILSSNNSPLPLEYIGVGSKIIKIILGGKNIMGFFNNDEDLRRGDKVLIKYMGIDGIIVDIDGGLYSVSYMAENEEEIVEDFYKDDLMKY